MCQTSWCLEDKHESPMTLNNGQPKEFRTNTTTAAPEIQTGILNVTKAKSTEEQKAA